MDAQYCCKSRPPFGFSLLLAIISVLPVLGGCERKDEPASGKGPMEQAGEKVKSAVDTVRESPSSAPNNGEKSK